MADLKMRPRFSVPVHCDAEMVVAALREHITDPEPGLEGSFGPTHCVLRIPEARRAFWSPELDLTFEPLENERGDPSPGVRVRCLFAPRPAVWTGFAFVYSALAAMGLASGLLGLTQMTLAQPPWALAISLAVAVLIACIYGASFLGQSLAAPQMYELRRYLDGCLARAEKRAQLVPKTSLDSARL